MDDNAGGRPLIGPMVRGDDFVLRVPDVPEAIWGSGSEVLWARGEALMCVADSGIGKTTLAGLLVRALIGCESSVLELPVLPATGRVLYLAMDRPQQAQRSLRRQFAPEDADVLAARLVARPGPPPEDVARDTSVLFRLAEEVGASHVVIDSVKDAAIGLSDDAVGSGYNRARQTLLAAGIELLELHHNRKQTAGTARPVSSLADVYGAVWLTSGAGSVIALNGDPGGSVIELRHLKQPAAEVGPLRITVDRAAGTMTTTPVSEVLDCLADAWRTPQEVTVLFEQVAKPSRAAVEKVRRRLDQLVADGAAVRGEPTMTGNGRTADRYRRTVPEDLHAFLHGAAREAMEPVR